MRTFSFFYFVIRSGLRIFMDRTSIFVRMNPKLKETYNVFKMDFSRGLQWIADLCKANPDKIKLLMCLTWTFSAAGSADAWTFPNKSGKLHTQKMWTVSLSTEWTFFFAEWTVPACLKWVFSLLFLSEFFSLRHDELYEKRPWTLNHRRVNFKIFIQLSYIQSI